MDSQTNSLEERIANLSPAKRALLEQHLQSRSAQTRMRQTIPPRAHAEPVPLSFAQQRLWFLERIQPDSTAYNHTSAHRLTGALDVIALQRSLDEIVRRHESLRTTFATQNGVPVQVVQPARPMTIAFGDLSQLAPDMWQSELQRQISAESQRLFDLSRDLMRRATVLRLSGLEHILLITSHHIACDGWSHSVFWRELSALYAAHTEGRSSPLPSLPVQYADYALWQRHWLQGERLAELQQFWQGQLDRSPELLNLPLDFPRPAVQASAGAAWHFFIPAALSRELKTLSRQNDSTLYMALLAAFHVLLARYTGQTDIVVGTPIAGRQHPELEGLIGMFVNTLVMRAELAGNPSFLTLLRQVRDQALEVYGHQELPFERIVELRQPTRSLSHHPIFQAMFALQNAPRRSLQLRSLEVEELPLERETAKFDLSMALTETASGLEGRIEYDTALFAKETIARMAEHYANLLQGILADPDCSIGQLPLLSMAERRVQLVDWNSSACAYPKDKHIHELFDAVVERTPEAVALIFGTEQLTFRQLNERANRLARYLKAAGACEEKIVGLWVDRSINMVVGMLAIVKTGAAYLPLDPAHPPEGVAYQLRDTRATILLSQGGLAATLPRCGAQVICFDTDRDLIAAQSPHLIEAKPDQPGGSEERLVYVMYTSGSTGRPKGVAIAQRAIKRLVCNPSYVTLSPGDRIAQASNAAFDASTFEVWGALLNGACLVGIDQDTLLSPQRLAAFLRHERIHVLFLTTALFHQIAVLQPDAFAPLRVLLFGGEKSDPAAVRAVLANHPPHTLLHVYGPTENTTFTTHYRVDNVPQDAHTIPIGRPIDATSVFVLDTHLNPVPIGVIGEVHTGGAGLAHGYLNHAELTADKFINNPFGPGRLYKTGDLARFWPDGRIEYVGRMDQQVKIRGFRVEPAEIEAVLRQQTGIAQALVVADTEAAGTKRLIAYLVPNTPHASSTQRVRQVLAQQLPEHMIPAAFVWLDRMPLTPNGKVDRKSLPAPAAGLIMDKHPAKLAGDALELQLLQIWKQVLRIRSIGLQDNFFELGGHSLLAAQLFELIAKVTGKELPLSVLFQAPTIELLAAILREHDWQPTWRSLVPVQAGGNKPPLFLVPPGASTVLRFANITRHLAVDQPVYGLEFLGMDGKGKPHGSVREIAEYHVADIRRLQPDPPYLLAGICFGAHIALEISQMLVDQGASVALLAVLDARPPMNGPTWAYPRRYGLEHFRLIQEYWREDGFMNWVESRISSRLNLLRKRIQPAQRAFLPVSSAHFRAHFAYHAKPYVGRIVMLQSQEFARRQSYRIRWESLAQGGFGYHMMTNSTHRSLLLEDLHAKPLADKLTELIHHAISETVE